MGEVTGTLGIILAIVFFLGAFGAWSEASQLQEQHDQYCGGIMEALLDWDGNCEELRQYISEIKTVAAGCGAFGLLLIIVGSIELSAAQKKKVGAIIHVPQTTTYQTIPQQVPNIVVQPQVQPHSTTGYCSSCGTPFASIEANFCNNCGKARS